MVVVLLLLLLLLLLVVVVVVVPEDVKTNVGLPIQTKQQGPRGRGSKEPRKSQESHTRRGNRVVRIVATTKKRGLPDLPRKENDCLQNTCEDE